MKKSCQARKNNDPDKLFRKILSAEMGISLSVSQFFTINCRENTVNMQESTIEPKDHLTDQLDKNPRGRAQKTNVKGNADTDLKADINGNSDTDLKVDLQAIERIAAIPTILEVVCQTTGMGFAAVARVTPDRWIACSVLDKIHFGLKPGGELKVESTICHEIRQNEKPVIINHVKEDPFYCNHHTPLMYGFQSYISMPIFRRDGRFFGTLCAIDPNPADLNNPKVIGMFTLFAEMISMHLSTQEDLEKLKSDLDEERKTSVIRDEFIAILGHDLRNPVSAVSGSAQVLLRMPLDENARKLATIIKNSTYRIRGLIDNVLDFARGRMGDGIHLVKKPVVLQASLYQIVSEIQAMYPERLILSEINLPKPVECDANRIAQLFGNLLGNALSHGDANNPVSVSAEIVGDFFILKVSNSGHKIPEHIQQRLFQPFARGEAKPGQQGLGLGLYISSEIAQAHKGSLQVDSTEQLTTFTLTIPA